MHINILDLKAILLALKSFVKAIHKHIKVMCDNTTTIHFINKMGASHSMECHHQVLGMNSYSKKLSFSSSHSMETKHSYLLTRNLDQIMMILNRCSNQSFESGIRTFIFQTRDRSIWYQYYYTVWQICTI